MHNASKEKFTEERRTRIREKENHRKEKKPSQTDEKWKLIDVVAETKKIECRGTGYG